MSPLLLEEIMAEYGVAFEYTYDGGDAGDVCITVCDTIDICDEWIEEYAKEGLIDWDYEFEGMLDNKTDEELITLLGRRLKLMED